MTFTFDVEEAAKRTSYAANPAKPANPARSAEQISSISNISDDGFREYTTADLAETDSLIREIAEREQWAPSELEDMLDQRRRMAPVNVYGALEALRAAGDGSAPRQNAKRAKRTRIALCVIEAPAG